MFLAYVKNIRLDEIIDKISFNLIRLPLKVGCF